MTVAQCARCGLFLWHGGECGRCHGVSDDAVAWINRLTAIGGIWDTDGTITIGTDIAENIVSNSDRPSRNVEVRLDRR